MALVKRNNIDLNKFVKASVDKRSPGFDCTQQWSTLGDLHGNALKLLEFNYAQGIVDVDENAYEKMVGVNKKALSKEWDDREDAVSDFYAGVLPHVEVTRGALFRSMGDALGDRGANDLYTLEFINHLMNGGAHVETLLSNHDRLFILWMETRMETGERVPFWQRMGSGAAHSLKRLDELVAKGVIDFESLIPLYETYKKTLKALSYDELENGELILYSHAHVDERILFEIAEGLLLFLDDIPKEISHPLSALCNRLAESAEMISVEDTKALVNHINAIIQEGAANNALVELLDLNVEEMASMQRNGYGIDPMVNPLYYLMWSRADLNELASRPKNPKITNVHGHHTYESPEPMQSHAISLDNLLGKEGEKESNVGESYHLETTPMEAPKRRASMKMH